jgi:hypothetical protein
VAANELDDSDGHRLPINFKVRVAAVALQLAHNWSVKVLGGELVSQVAAPYIYQQLHVADAKSTNENLSNVNVVPIAIVNHKGIVFWRYDLQFETLALGYQKGAASNIGQHNIAFTPSAAITLLPHGGAQNIMSRFDYIINNPDHASHYHSGNEFFWQFDVQEQIPRHKASGGVEGYFYKQITNDSQNGAAVIAANADGTQSIGNKGRVLDLGPQVTFPWGKHGALIFKWDHDLLVQNKVRGNSFWFQFGIPLSYLRHPIATTR